MLRVREDGEGQVDFRFTPQRPLRPFNWVHATLWLRPTVPCSLGSYGHVNGRCPDIDRPYRLFYVFCALERPFDPEGGWCRFPNVVGRHDRAGVDLSLFMVALESKPARRISLKERSGG